MIAVDSNILIYAHREDSPFHQSAFESLSALAGRVSGAPIHDARIAALCHEHGVTELWSADRDFSRFPNLKVVNPLVRVR